MYLLSYKLFSFGVKVFYFSHYKNYKKYESFINIFWKLGIKPDGPNLRISAPHISFLLCTSGQLGNISEQNRLGYLALWGYIIAEGKNIQQIINIGYETMFCVRLEAEFLIQFLSLLSQLLQAERRNQVVHSTFYFSSSSAKYLFIIYKFYLAPNSRNNSSKFSAIRLQG